LLWLAAVAVMALAAIVPVGSSLTTAGAANSKQDGVVCTTNSANGQSNFLLTAKDGYIQMPDGNAVFMWSYSYNNTGFQHPGPVLCVTEGETVNITLANALPVATSIQFPGLDSVKANGALAAPQFDTNGELVSLTNDAQPGQQMTYTFKASKPGTFLYQSGTDPHLQVQMGLFGTIIVRPVQGSDPGNPQAAYAYDYLSAPNTFTAEPDSIYNKDKEYVLMLSEIDPDLHVQVEQGFVNDSSQIQNPYKAHYFLINGRAFPDTVAPNNAPWLPTQPYGALARVQPYNASTNALPAMLRYVGVGVDTYPFHPHSNHEKIIGIDGRYLRDGNAKLFSEKFGIVVTPGNTQDATFIWTNVEDYGGSQQLHVASPNPLNLTQGDFWNGTPFLGQTHDLNPGINPETVCGEYYHVAHSHNLTQATNYGASFGGMLTLIRVDPPNDASCG
jgi:FtsP/CotA-like multicopper oxidase with cupredoxin domain